MLLERLCLHVESTELRSKMVERAERASGDVTPLDRVELRTSSNRVKSR